MSLDLSTQRPEVLEQGVKGEFLLDADVVVPHNGGEFRLPWRRGRHPVPWLPEWSSVFFSMYCEVTTSGYAT